MKNIFLLPTDKPSYLFIIDKSKMFVPEAPYLSYTTVGGRVHKTEGSDICRPQFIYIINDEKIEDGNWVFQECLNMPHRLIKTDTENVKVLNDLNKCKKIVLTNDTSLIEDGVQSIDDEFLEWFVKNPSCEEVEVMNVPDFIYETKHSCYKIIIPKSEYKQEFCDNCNNNICCCIVKTQETLEEAAETELYITINKIIDGGKDLPKGHNVTRGQAVDYAFETALKIAKWQKERSIRSSRKRKSN